MNKSDLSQIIKIYLKELGFTHVGITSAISTSDAKQNLDKWINNKFNGTMEWMQKRKVERGDIFEYYPDAKSIISVGINYFSGRAKSDVKISNYAWGDDYHYVLKNKLHNALKKIKELNPKISGRICVDTSPVMEKTWAQKAGIGWIGKHTNLITTDYGSWIFLGEIILNTELEFDKEFNEDLCGSCTACLDACPVEAFPSAYQIDASKCISYLTIEYRDDFSPQVDNHNWVYGCDICQEVCPWNKKFEKETNEISFKERQDVKEKNFNLWLNMTKEDFNRIFKKSAVKRTKFSGFKRNLKNIFNSKIKNRNEKANP